MKNRSNKNDMRKIKQFVLFLGLFIFAIGCTDNFGEYNTNPNEATKEMRDWDNVYTGSLFLQMEQNVMVIAQPGAGIGTDRYQTVEVMGGDGFAGYFGFAAPHINSAGRYNWEKRSWYGDMFTTNYTRTMNAWRELRKAVEDDTDPRFSIAQINKVAAMHRVTDTYGPIPYKGFGTAQVVPYDSQKDVYYMFFEELNQAVKNLDSYASAGEKIYSAWDRVYNGDAKAWIKFANTLRLRLALHIVYADPAKAKIEAEAAVANAHGLLETAADVAELKHEYPIANYESPLYIIKNWDDVHMGATIDSYMNGYNDPRRTKYFIAGTGSQFRGIRAGMPGNIAKATYIDGNYFATPNVTASTNVVWMRGSESYFLRAEGAIRLWEMNGTAKDLYEQGIKVSFDEHGVGNATSYVENNTDTPANYTDPITSGHSINARGTITVAWDEDAGFEEKLERIITQKYLALFPVGQEAWTEFRRTGYPKVFPVVVNESNGGSVNNETQIRRLPYPENEVNTNKDELDKGIILLGGPDNPGTRLWWDAKNQ